MNEKNHGPLKILPSEEMKDVLSSAALEKRRLFVAGYADFSAAQLILFRGDGTSVVAPFSMFEKSNAKVEPNFQELDIIDHGQTVKLGEYEASTRSILIDLDPEYKKYCDSIRNLNIN